MSQLPNQKTTWAALSASVEEFSDWRKRTSGSYGGENGELLAYLSDQLGVEGAALKGSKFNHPVLGLLSYMSENNNRMRELLFAYLALAVANDSEPAKRLIAGQRLHVGLHSDYVAATCCYGDKGVLASEVIEDAVHNGDPLASSLSGGAVVLPAFEDPDVQRAYGVLCDESVDGKPREDHWEGWVARRIVAALRNQNTQN